MKDVRNKIVCGDCIEILGQLEPCVDLVFADPPFNIGYKYDKYHDKKKKDQYLAWTHDWIKACMDVLKPAGSIYIAIGDDYAANVKMIAEELGLHWRNWIIWHYTFGQQTQNKFARSHTHILYFSKDKKEFTFNDYAVRVPSDRQLIYNDKRANSVGKIPDDTWNEYPRVCGTFKERAGWHPCQMPESVLSRIIAASSNEGDMVLDPFMGSGTTAAVGLQMERLDFGVDISEDYVRQATDRLARLYAQIRSTSHIFFSTRELFELKRLYGDLGIGAKEIIQSHKLMGVFASQFAVRMQQKKGYDPEKVASALLEFEK